MSSSAKQSLFQRVAIVLPVMLVGLFATANAYGTVVLDTQFQNYSFEAGNGPPDPLSGVGCPNFWNCGGSPSPGFTSYLVTSAQFTAGSDGLPGSLIVPDGTHAAYSPTVVEGSGTLAQQLLATTYASNTVYQINLWVGTPKTEINGTTPVTAPVSTITAYFYQGNLSTQTAAFSLAAPVVGQWTKYSLNLDTSVYTGAVGQQIGFGLFVDSGGNDRIANFDIASAVPEPASFALLGLGLVGLGVARKKLRS